MWVAVLALGCPKRAIDPSVAIAAAVDASDEAWAARTEGGLAAVGAPLLDAWTLHRGHPEVGWRVVRWRIAEGDAAADPVEARASWAEARAEMMNCLDGDGLFEQRRREAGWEAALRRLAPERRACAAWGALAWARWWESLGPEAAALDLPAIDALLAATAEGRIEEASAWAAGIVTAHRPDEGRDLDRAESLLRETLARDPASLRRQLDLWRATRGDRRGPSPALATPRRPEDVGTWQRCFGNEKTAGRECEPAEEAGER